MVDQSNYQQGYAGTKRQGSEVLHSEDEDHIVQTTKSKGIVNVQLFIRSKFKDVRFLFSSIQCQINQQMRVCSLIFPSSDPSLSLPRLLYSHRLQRPSQ